MQVDARRYTPGRRGKNYFKKKMRLQRRRPKWEPSERGSHRIIVHQGLFLFGASPMGSPGKMNLCLDFGATSHEKKKSILGAEFSEKRRVSESMSYTEE